MDDTDLYILLVIITIGTNAQENMNISAPILNIIKNLGMNISNANFTELEPEELTSFDNYSKEDNSFQEKYVYVWSTFQHKYLDKFNIVTKSSSTLKGYPTSNLFDKKVETAWIEGVKGDGIGEWISMDIHTEKKASPSVIAIFGMIPGYQKNDKTWEENNRVKKAILIIRIPTNGFDYAIFRLKFKDFKGLQIFQVGKFQNSATFDKKIWLIIEDIYKGTKYSDTCISEIYIRGGCIPPEE